MNKNQQRCNQRLNRVSAVLNVDDPDGFLSSEREWTGITSSRLGHDCRVHQRVCRYLSRSILDARSRNALIVIAKGSAIEPWATRAANLWGVPWVRICVDCSSLPNDCDAEIHLGASGSSKLDRDHVLVQLVDRLDAVHVRKGGTIASAIERRLSHDRDANVRVVISGEPKCAGIALVTAGAVGWYSPRSEPASLEKEPPVFNEVHGMEPWTTTSGEWLIHCTRGRRGPWPDETEGQYMDQLILGAPDTTRRAPIDALARILRTRRLLASAVTSSQSYPVVCFTDVSLRDTLARRCFRSHLGRWDYEPFGIAIRKTIAEALGVQPVIYGPTKQRKQIQPSDQYRFHPIGRTQDWRQEREWRSRHSIDLSELASDDVRVFARDSVESRQRLAEVDYPVTWLTPKSLDSPRPETPA